MPDEDLSLPARVAGNLLVLVCMVFPIGVLGPLGYVWWVHGSAASVLSAGGPGAAELLGFLVVRPDVVLVTAVLLFLAANAFSVVGPGGLSPPAGGANVTGLGDGSDDDDGFDGEGDFDAGGFDAGGFDGGE